MYMRPQFANFYSVDTLLKPVMTVIMVSRCYSSRSIRTLELRNKTYRCYELAVGRAVDFTCFLFVQKKESLKNWSQDKIILWFRWSFFSIFHVITHDFSSFTSQIIIEDGLLDCSPASWEVKFSNIARSKTPEFTGLWMVARTMIQSIRIISMTWWLYLEVITIF